jgi:hypothetical protein
MVERAPLGFYPCTSEGHRAWTRNLTRPLPCEDRRETRAGPSNFVNGLPARQSRRRRGSGKSAARPATQISGPVAGPGEAQHSEMHKSSLCKRIFTLKGRGRAGPSRNSCRETPALVPPFLRIPPRRCEDAARYRGRAPAARLLRRQEVPVRAAETRYEHVARGLGNS